MEPDYEKDLLLERYVKGQMKGAELQAFEERMGLEPELQEEVRLERDFQDAVSLSAESEIADMLGRIHEAGPPAGTGGTGTSFFRTWIPYASAAAVLLLGIVGFFIFQSSPTSADLFANAFDPYEDRISGRAPGDDPILKALESYKSGEWQAAATAFATIPDTAKFYTLAMIYQGNCYLQLKDATKAIPPLQIAESLHDPIHGDAAKWYLALAYLLADNTHECRRLLSELVAANAPKWSDKARDLLPKVKEK